jgi:hypothetical protein
MITSVIYQFLPTVKTYCAAFSAIYSAVALFHFTVFFVALSFRSALIPSATAQSQPIPSGASSSPSLMEAEAKLVPDDLQGKESSWLDATEDYLANSVHDFSVYIDQGLAKQDEEEAIPNRSYLRLRTQAEYSHLGDFESDGSVSVRVDLPHIERNWHLIFETDSDDYDSLENKQRDLSGSGDTNEPEGGVEYQNGLLYDWDTSLGTGMKLKLPLDPFVRGEIRRAEVFENKWVGQYKQRLFYYHTKGAGSLTELQFYYPMTDDNSQVFTMGSSAQYMFEDDQWELLFKLGASDRISKNHLLDYSAGVSIDPDESDKVNNYWLSLLWLQNIHKNWLYFSVIPTLEAPREYDYKLNPGVQVKLELFFSKNRSITPLNRSIPRSTRKEHKE